MSAAAIVGIAGSLAATPFVAGGIVQLSAGLVAMPGIAHASVPESGAERRFEPRDTSWNAEPARGASGDRPDRAFRVAAKGNGIGARPAPRFDDFDTRRFPAQPEAKELPPVAGRYAVIAGAPAPVLLASLDQRFASAALAAPDAFPMPVTTGEARAEVLTEIPLPVQRPRIGTRDNGPAAAALAMAAPLPERRPARSASARKRKSAADTALAYANPDAAVEEEKSDGVFGRLFGRRGESLLPGRGSKVAVYDIGAATVYMPNGEKLEAHSGLAHMKDNPRYVKEKNKGPTPPNLYKLRMREARFHGVEAIRLLPADGKKKFNRDGLLAHTYMYIGGGGKDRSQSNGCVVFAKYDRFLAAFKRGEIRHLIVVPHLGEVPTYMAAL